MSLPSSSSSSPSCVGRTEMMSLANLQRGVVQTFKPTYEDLVGHYLYTEIMTRNEKNNVMKPGCYFFFPEVDLYGESGMQPWEVWEYLECVRIPHQEFSYFFTKLKRLSGKKGRGKRCFRRVGSGEMMGAWSETESSKAINVCGGVDGGRMKKFRYENTKCEEHHAAWLMEEFSIEHLCSDLVLCRMKRNEKGSSCGRIRRKRRKSDTEVVNVAKMPRCSSVVSTVNAGEVVIVSRNGDGECEQGGTSTCWLDDLLEVEPSLDTSQFESHISADQAITASQSREEEAGTGYDVSTSDQRRCSYIDAEDPRILSADDFGFGENVADPRHLESACNDVNNAGAEDVIVSQNGDGECEQGGTTTFWLHDALEVGTSYNVSTSDQRACISPSMLSQQQQQDMSPADDLQGFGSVCGDDFFRFEDFDNCFA